MRGLRYYHSILNIKHRNDYGKRIYDTATVDDGFAAAL